MGPTGPETAPAIARGVPSTIVSQPVVNVVWPDDAVKIQSWKNVCEDETLFGIPLIGNWQGGTQW